MDLNAVRHAGERVLERGRFSARTVLDVPEGGVRSVSKCTVDLDLALARVSTMIRMGPADGAATTWTPRSGDPVVHWVAGDHLLMQLPDEDGDGRWISLPDTPLLSSALSLLLWPAGVIEASVAQEDSGTISAVVDLGEVIERAPAIHAAGIAQSIEEMALTADEQVAVELTLADGALSQIDAQLPDVERATRLLVHLSIDPDVPAPLGDPPDPQEAFDAGELERWVEAYVPGGPQWWTRTRPFRV